MNDGRELALIADGARMLAEARSLFEVRDVRSVAIAAAAYARAKDLGEDAVRSASRIVVLATARIGEEIIAGQERGEISRQDRHPGSVTASDTAPATLPELGISRNLASAGERLARHPEAVRDYLAETTVPSLVGALRAAARSEDDQLAEIVERIDPEVTRVGRVDEAMVLLDRAATIIIESRPHTPEQVGRLMRKASYVLAICRPAGPRNLEVLRDDPDTAAL